MNKKYFISIICYLTDNNEHQELLIDINIIDKYLYNELLTNNYIIDIYIDDKDNYFVKYNSQFYNINKNFNYNDLIKFISYKYISNDLLNKILLSY